MSPKISSCTKSRKKTILLPYLYLQKVCKTQKSQQFLYNIVPKKPNKTFQIMLSFISSSEYLPKVCRKLFLPFKNNILLSNKQIRQRSPSTPIVTEKTQQTTTSSIDIFILQNFQNYPSPKNIPMNLETAFSLISIPKSTCLL